MYDIRLTTSVQARYLTSSPSFGLLYPVSLLCAVLAKPGNEGVGNSRSVAVSPGTVGEGSNGGSSMAASGDNPDFRRFPAGEDQANESRVYVASTGVLVSSRGSTGDDEHPPASSSRVSTPGAAGATGVHGFSGVDGESLQNLAAPRHSARHRRFDSSDGGMRSSVTGSGLSGDGDGVDRGSATRGGGTVANLSPRPHSAASPRRSAHDLDEDDLDVNHAGASPEERRARLMKTRSSDAADQDDRVSREVPPTPSSTPVPTPIPGLRPSDPDHDPDNDPDPDHDHDPGAARWSAGSEKVVREALGGVKDRLAKDAEGTAPGRVPSQEIVPKSEYRVVQLLTTTPKVRKQLATREIWRCSR